MDTTLETTAAPSLAQHAQEAAVLLPLTLLKPSPTNPRKNFVQSKLDELATSIKQLGGVFQPILARPNPQHTAGDGQPPYEIVAGERRWRASQQAGLGVILTLVRELSDFEALEIQVIENMERADLHPLEEAEGMKRLLRSPTGLQGYATAEDLAARLGKSRRWVFARLALLNLCEEAREAFLAGTLNASIAGLIARMPDAAQQAEATRHLVAGWGGEPYSYRAAAEYLAKEFMLSLAKAPFDIEAIYPIAGPCGTCKKRSGANPDLFEDVKSGDMCQDSACFHTKTEQAREAQLQEARSAGHTVLAGDAARKLMVSTTYLPNGYHWYDRACELATSTQPLRELMGSKTRDVITLDHPAGPIISLVPDAAVRKLLKAKGLLKAPPAPAEEPEQQAEAGAEEATTTIATASPSAPAARPAPPAAQLKPRSPGELAMETETLAGELYGVAVHTALHKALRTVQELPLRAVQLLVMKCMDDATAEEFKLLYQVRGWDIPTSNQGWPFHNKALTQDLERRLGELSGRDMGEILIETLVLCELTDRPSLESLQDSEYLNAPTLTLATELGIEGELATLHEQTQEEANQLVCAAEAERLGLPDATAAFVQAHARTAMTAAERAGNVKYRNPATGETWSGRGLQPTWLKVRISEGASLDDFKVAA